MKATGMIRKIDDLGRIVIPKELRKNLKIKTGEPLEIFIDDEGDLIFKKYLPMLDISEISEQIATILSEVTGYNCIITDTNSVLVAIGKNVKEYIGKEISMELYEIMEERVILSTKNEKSINITKEDMKLKHISQIVAPIISDADAIGAIVLFSNDYNKKITDNEYQLLKVLTKYIGKQGE